MNKLLLEIRTEEIPASYIPRAAKRLKETALKKFQASLLPHGEIEAYGSPRRIVLTADGIPAEQKRETKKVSGPPVRAAVDKDGNPTKAGLGFAKKFGKDFSEVKTKSTPKGDYLYLMIEEGGGKSEDILKKILPQIIEEIPFPKTMRWGGNSKRFARPIRSILAKLGDKTLSFSLESLESGDKTYGHRFLSDGSLPVANPDAYLKTLKENFVYANPKEREKIIAEELERVEKEENFKAIIDDELLDMVCYITEYPVGVAGRFDKKYLALPREVLMTVLKYHQKYFAVEDANGNITNGFIAFSNIKCGDMSNIKKGFERVLSARLSDAQFFFDNDRKRKLAQFAEKLSGITYQKKLGTMADRSKRVEHIALNIFKNICPDKKDAVETVAKLCKADLTTSMIYEFPELQGVMGREYAKAEGIDNEVATAIDEHYMPRFSGDALPSSDVGACLALADKIETIAGFFALGKIPTGSEDPFSLRRHALGIIRMLLKKTKEVSLSALIDAGIKSLPSQLCHNNLKSEILAFFAGRIKADFTAKGIPYDVVDSVLSAGFDNLPDTLKRAEALAEMKKEEYSENLSTTFKRATQIIKEHGSTDINESALVEEVEKKLFESIKACEEKVLELIKEKDYSEALKEIAAIRSDVDAFFDGVMVMADDDTIRTNRLSLLRRVTKLFEGLANFSKLVFS